MAAENFGLTQSSPLTTGSSRSITSGTSGSVSSGSIERNRLQEEYDALLLKQNIDRLKAGQSPVGANGVQNNLPDFDKLYNNILDKEFSNNLRLMDASSTYRNRDGETAGQRDAQARLRLGDQLQSNERMQERTINNQQYMQQRGQELTDWQRDQDFNRAFRGINRFRGLSTGGTGSAMNNYR